MTPELTVVRPDTDVVDVHGTNAGGTATGAAPADGATTADPGTATTADPGTGTAPFDPSAADDTTPTDVEAAARDLRAGHPVLVTGARVGGGPVLAVGASHADHAAINVLVHEARGVVCLALTAARCDRLGLRRMRESDPVRPGRDLLVTIEARDGTTTGISAADRARTVAAACDPRAIPADLVSPGHVVPMRTAAGGVLEVAGPGEAALELLRLAGTDDPAAVLCAVLDDDGEPATGEGLHAIADRLGARVVAVDDVVAAVRAADAA